MVYFQSTVNVWKAAQIWIRTEAVLFSDLGPIAMILSDILLRITLETLRWLQLSVFSRKKC